MDELKQDITRLEQHYAALFREHGDSPEGVQQRDRTTQEVRMRRLCEVGELANASVLDWGCGSGHLLQLLTSEFGYEGQYTGYDLSEPHLEAGRAKFPGASFKRRDILEEGAGGEFDFVLVNGVFNNAISDNWLFMTSALTTLFAATRKGLAFNALSTYVDYFDEGLYYVDPGKVFDFCKRSLGPLVTLRHDYRVKPSVTPYEFTVYVRRD
jgi:SAM-dependent methyltransferase